MTAPAEQEDRGVEPAGVPFALAAGFLALVHAATGAVLLTFAVALFSPHGVLEYIVAACLGAVAAAFFSIRDSRRRALT